MDVTKYLKKLGYDTVSSSFYKHIRDWRCWYTNSVSGFHNYNIYNGKTHVRMKRFSLGMAKKVCEDIADLLMSEKVEVHAMDDRTDEMLHAVFKINNFDVLVNEYQERKACTGTVAYVPCILDAMVMPDGTIAADGGRIGINCCTAEDIYPLTWANGTIEECAFVFHKYIGGKEYCNIQIHVFDGTEYVIENHVVEASGTGKEIPQEKWEELKPFAGMQAVINTGSDKRQFVIDRLNIANNVDETNPMGISIFANSIDQLRAVDTTYDSYVNEFVLGKKRIFASLDTMMQDALGNPVFDPNDVVFYQLPEDGLEKGKTPIVESNMALRSAEHNAALNDQLNMLSVKCGFGTKHYRFDQGSVATATQVISENSDMFRTLKKHEIILESVLVELCEIVLHLLNVIGYGVDEEAEIRVDFDDSIIEDRSAERDQDRQDVAMGAMTLLDYRMKWYAEDEEEAARHIVTEVMEPDYAEE